MDIIRSEETGGMITGVALASLIRFIESGLFDQVIPFYQLFSNQFQGLLGTEVALDILVDGIAHCRFAATGDPPLTASLYPLQTPRTMRWCS